MTGYDGNGFEVGDRVELHPGTDLWARGARFGTVVGRTRWDRVRVKLDKVRGIVTGTEDTFRHVETPYESGEWIRTRQSLEEGVH